MDTYCAEFCSNKLGFFSGNFSVELLGMPTARASDYPIMLHLCCFYLLLFFHFSSSVHDKILSGSYKTANSVYFNPKELESEKVSGISVEMRSSDLLCQKGLGSEFSL